MSTVAVAIAQFAPTADRAANIVAITALTEKAAERGAQVVVFPEYSSFFVNPFDESLRKNAESIDGPFVQSLIALASRLSIVIVAGLLEASTAAGKVRNTVVAVSAEGVVASYRKQHLYDAFGQRESDWVEPGELVSPEIFEASGVRFGLMTCYDVRFPESSRVIADAGAHAILVPAQWVRGPLKEHHWLTLTTARAIENTLYVAGADHPPPLGVGTSVVIDPQGVVVAQIGTGTDVAVAHIDVDAVERVRRVNPALTLRRYGVIPRA